jgi:hypothetical protein
MHNGALWSTSSQLMMMQLAKVNVLRDSHKSESAVILNDL